MFGTKDIWLLLPHFTDSKENLKQTFTYLNSALQHEKLNRGEWRLLEAQERVWADSEILEIYIKVVFSNKSEKLTTGGVVPDGFYKTIYFTKSGKTMCFYFPNQAPTKKWNEYQIKYK
jgi:DNA/RNA endonuclease G (NUC1)